MITAIFPTVFLGGLFGKVLADSGAAQSIASTLVNKFVMPVNNKEKQAKRAVLIMLLIECILTLRWCRWFRSYLSLHSRSVCTWQAASVFRDVWFRLCWL